MEPGPEMPPSPPRRAVTDKDEGMIRRAFAVWILLLVLAILNGGIRETLLAPRFGEPAGHVLSTIVLCALIFLVSFLCIRWIGPAGPRDPWMVGLFWVVFTVAFEFLAGHFVFGRSWERLLADYHVTEGRIWILVLAADVLAPPWAARLRSNDA